MDDFTYDCLQKKRIAQSAKKRVGLRKGCILPSDYLTPAQKKKLNGDVISVNLNKPISYKYFKVLSEDMQTMYYNHLVDEFGVLQADIAKMFGVTNNSLCSYLSKRGISVHKQTNTKADQLRRKANEEKWQLFLAGKYQPNKESEEIDISDGSESDEKDPDSSFGKKLTSYRLEFTDATNWMDILRTLSQMPIKSDSKIVVTVEGV